MKCVRGHQPYRPCIYKQEDVKVNLLNPKSEQHLICGCSKNNECREEKEILTSSWSFVLEWRTKLKLHVLDKFLPISVSFVWAMFFETFVGNFYQSPREICATSGATKFLFSSQINPFVQRETFLKINWSFHKRTVLSIVSEKYCHCNATRVPFRFRNGSNDWHFICWRINAYLAVCNLMLYITRLEETLKWVIVSSHIAYYVSETLEPYLLYFIDKTNERKLWNVLVEFLSRQSVDRLNVGIKYSLLNWVLLVGYSRTYSYS